MLDNELNNNTNDNNTDNSNTSQSYYGSTGYDYNSGNSGAADMQDNMGNAGDIGNSGSDSYISSSSENVSSGSYTGSNSGYTGGSSGYTGGGSSSYTGRGSGYVSGGNDYTGSGSGYTGGSSGSSYMGSSSSYTSSSGNISGGGYAGGNSYTGGSGSAGYTGAVPPKTAKKEKKKGKAGKFFKKVLAIVASAALFGAVAGGVMYGVYSLGVSKIQEEQEKENVDIPIISDKINPINTSTIASNGGATDSMNVKAVAKAAMPAMVALQGKTTVTSSNGIFGYGQSYESKVSGTGIIVGKNDTELLILTNAHVVEEVSGLQCIFIDEASVDAVVKGSKSDKDIAVVAVKLADISADTLKEIAIAELGESDDVVIGEQVVAIGNALGEGQSVTDGIISAINRSITISSVKFEGLFMTNAAINSGNSGGALLNADGKVIGINFAKTSEDGVEGMAYSIPVSNVKDLINSLMNRETRSKVSDSEAGAIGITSGIDITSSVASYYGFPQGVQIRSVQEGSAAEKAGLGKYDIIVGFDDQTVTSLSGLKSILQYYKAGETVKVEYYHIEGNQYVLKTVDLTLDKKN